VSVTGGLIPSGCGWNNVFAGTYYVFADTFAGWARALQVNAGRTGFVGSPLDFADFGGDLPVSIRMGPDGSLYVVMHGAGTVHRLTPSTFAGPDCPAAPVPGTSIPWVLLLGAVLALAGARRLRMAPS
jgi:hypothetical protein